jgi:ketosteroid isomerase-like protein
MRRRPGGDGGTHRGLAAVQDVVRRWGEVYDELRVIGRYRTRLKGGEEMETWFVDVLDVAGGKVTRFRNFSDKAARLAPVFGATAAP